MKGFRSFLLRGNVVDLAVGIVIGAAFTDVVKSFVTAFLTPIVGLITGKTGDFSSAAATISGVTFPYGALISAAISFVLVAAVVYFGVVLPLNRLHQRFLPKKEAAVTTRECPECLSTIPVAARRCSFCTVEVGTVEVASVQAVPYQHEYPTR